MLSVSNRRILRKLLLWLCIFLVLILAIQGARAIQAVLGVRQTAYEILVFVDQDSSDWDLAELTELIGVARSETDTLQRTIRPFLPLTHLLGWIPKLGPTLAAAEPLSIYAASLTEAGDEILQVILPMLEEGAGDTTSMTSQLIEGLCQGTDKLDRADEALARATEAEASLQIDQLIAPIQEPLSRLEGKLPLAQQGMQILGVLPTLLGEETPQRYLIMAQNEDELRATGGFISGVGILEIDRGEIVTFTMGDSYSVDDFSKTYPAPPQPLLRYMLAEQWLVRDANWSPDFPSAAQQVRDLYQHSTGESTGGVVAFDQIAIERILAAIGPVELPDVQTPVTAENVRQYMRQAWEPTSGSSVSSEWWAQRKDFMAILGSAMMTRLQQPQDRVALINLARTALELLYEKHLLLWIDDPIVSQALGDAGLAGALSPGPGDFLMVVDSNLGFNKMDARIDRAIHYTVDLYDPAVSVAMLKLTYRNTVEADIPCEHTSTYGSGRYEDLQTRCYWDYVRVYTPAGTQLIQGDLPPVSGEYLLSGESESGEWSQTQGESGTMVYSGLMMLPTRAESILSLHYRLPATTLDTTQAACLTYNLTLVKQPGKGATDVTMAVRPPQGYSLLDHDGWSEDPEGYWRSVVSLTRDVTLQFCFVPLP